MSLTRESMKTHGSNSVADRRIDPWWRKARVAARLLLKKELQPWSLRDRRLAAQLSVDPGVTNRLIDQAVSFLKARKNGYRLMDRHD